MLLAVAKRIHRGAVYSGGLRQVSSGPVPLRDDCLIVGSSRELVQRLGSQVEVRTGFITEEEERALLLELEPGLRKKRYEFDHWDDVSPANVSYSVEWKGMTVVVIIVVVKGALQNICSLVSGFSTHKPPVICCYVST